ncbi:MAG: phosphate/phosphite/phosphonate ABC transporter substrate-binding protein [Actinomycetota bacterium]
MRTLSRLLLVLLLLSAGLSVSAAEPLKVILLPFTNTATLMKVHQPIRQHLQAALGRPVELYTSADFPAHFDEVRRGAFDVAITGPHFGAWAVDHGHRGLLRYRPNLSPLLAVRKDSNITGPAQLRGKKVVLSNRLSTSSLGGERWLVEAGLVAGRDYTLSVSPTHTTAIMAVAMGEADAAITTHTPIQQAPADIRDRIAEVVSPIAVPHLFTVANARMSADEAAEIKAALLSFESSPEGRAFFAETGYEGYVELTAADVRAMQPTVELLMRLVEAPKP